MMNNCKESFDRLVERYASYDTVDDFVEMKRYIESLEKALDRACKKLFDEMATIQVSDYDYRFLKSSDEWKGWCMKDD